MAINRAGDVSESPGEPDPANSARRGFVRAWVGRFVAVAPVVLMVPLVLVAFGTFRGRVSSEFLFATAIVLWAIAGARYLLGVLPKHARFRTNELLGVIAIASIYLAALTPAFSKATLELRVLAMAVFAPGVGAYYLALFFHGIGPPDKSKVGVDPTPELVVKAPIPWGRHFRRAILLAIGWGFAALMTDDPELIWFVLGGAIGSALGSHVAVSRQRVVRLLPDGVEAFGETYLDDRSQWGLVEYGGELRLVGERRNAVKLPRPARWPVIPADQAAAVRKILAAKDARFERFQAALLKQRGAGGLAAAYRK